MPVRTASALAGNDQRTEFQAIPPTRLKLTRNKSKLRRLKKLPPEPIIPDKVVAELSINFDLDVYLRYFPAIPEAGKIYLRKAMMAPSRNPGGTSNCERFTSQKTRQTFFTESDAVSLPSAIMCERLPNVLFFVEEAPELSLVYRAGRSTATTTTIPDAILFTTTGPIIVETKPIENTAKIAIRQPGRYSQNPDGTFRSDPLEAAARELGLTSRVLCERNFSSSYLKNQMFLLPYYRRDLLVPITSEERAVILATVKDSPGISAGKLPLKERTRLADVVHKMIVDREIFANLSADDVLRFDQLRLFSTPIQEKAFELFRGEGCGDESAAVPLVSRLPVGAEIRVKRTKFQIESHGAHGLNVINCATKVAETIPYTLLHAANIRVETDEKLMATCELIRSLDEGRLQRFLKNRRRIAPYLPAGRLFGFRPKDRHVRRLLRAFHLGGDRAIIPYENNRGNETKRKSEEAEAILDKAVARVLSPRAPSATSVYYEYKKDAEAAGLTERQRHSKRTFLRRVAEIRPYDKARAQGGPGKAMAVKPPGTKSGLLGNPNGRSPWALGHIDHTLIDVLVRNPETGEYERPWISAMVDGYDGRILAAFIWFGSPKASVVMEVIKDCIRRHGVLPLRIRCDWGSEFRSVLVQKLLASIGVSIAFRPKKKARSGAPIESAFQGFNLRFFHNREANTKALKNPRQLTKEFRPDQFALWTLDRFLVLTDDYIATVNKAPRAFKPSPNDMYLQHVAAHGQHCAQWLSVELIDRLNFTTLPKNTTRIVSAKATIRVLTVDYTADELQDLIGQEVVVYENRNDPRTVQIDHPKTRLRVVCKASTGDVRYAESAAEAKEIVARRDDGSYQRLKEADEYYAAFAARVRQAETSLAAAPDLSVAAAAPSEPEADEADEDSVVPFMSESSEYRGGLIMNPIQQYLFPEMAKSLTDARDRLVRMRDLVEAHNPFVGAIAAHVLNADKGGLVLVACSPAIQQDRIVSDLLRYSPPKSVAHDPFEDVLQFSAPPETTTSRDQVRTLHDRYRVSANQLHLQYKLSAQYSEPMVPPGLRKTEVEGIAAMLQLRRPGLVCITQAHNLISSSRSLADATRLLSHLDDIACRSGVRHIAFGDRALICATAKRSRGQFPVVVQPMYDCNDKSDSIRFSLIVRHCDSVLKDCSNFKLYERSERLMKTVGGDPCRLSRWVSEAVCHAAALGHETVQWSHMCATQPARDEINAAYKELALYREFQAGDDLYINEFEPEVQKKGGGRPVGRKPSRDAVPPVAAA